MKFRQEVEVTAYRSTRPLTIRAGEWLVIFESGEMAVFSDSLYKSLISAPAPEPDEAVESAGAPLSAAPNLPTLQKEDRSGLRGARRTGYRKRDKSDIEEHMSLVLLALTEEYQPTAAVVEAMYGKEYTDKQTNLVLHDLIRSMAEYGVERIEIGGGQFRRRWAWRKR